MALIISTRPQLGDPNHVVRRPIQISVVPIRKKFSKCFVLCGMRKVACMGCRQHSGRKYANLRLVRSNLRRYKKMFWFLWQRK